MQLFVIFMPSLDFLMLAKIRQNIILSTEKLLSIDFSIKIRTEIEFIKMYSLQFGILISH